MFLDLPINNFLYSIRDPFWTELLLWVTHLGDIAGIIIVGTLLTSFLFVRKNYLHIGAFFISLFSGGILAILIKMIIKRPRPEWPFPVYTAESLFSFPSFHATVAVILYGFIAYIVWHTSIGSVQATSTSLSARKIRWISTISVILIILVIGFTRLYLGVHYFSDVIGGYILGTLCLARGIYFIKKSNK